MELEFEWDPEKARRNHQKHGVSFEEASTVFGDSLSATASDPNHSYDEDRYIIMGNSNHGRVLLVSHTDRDDRIRIISARTLTRAERRQYEESEY